MCRTCGCSEHHLVQEPHLTHEQMHTWGIEHHHHPENRSVIEVEKDILSHNNHMPNVSEAIWMRGIYTPSTWSALPAPERLRCWRQP